MVETPKTSEKGGFIILSITGDFSADLLLISGIGLSIWFFIIEGNDGIIFKKRKK